MVTKGKPNTWYNMFRGNLSEDRCQDIWNIVNQKDVPELRHMIYNFPDDMIIDSIEKKKSIRRMLRERNITKEELSNYYGTLRKYQTVGTAFLCYSPKSMIGDGVGAGKTPQIAGMLNYERANGRMKRFVMAVEKSAVGQTQAEMIRFTGMYIVALPGEGYKMEKVIANTDWEHVDGIIIRHPTLRSDTFMRWIAKYIDRETGKIGLFDTFILDESSVIKNNKTKIFEYVQGMCNRVDRVHLMNATSFETKIMDIYYQFDLMDQNLLPSEKAFRSDHINWTRISFYKTVGTGAQRKPQLLFKWAPDEQNPYKNQKMFKDSLRLRYLGRSSEELGIERENAYKVCCIDPTPAMMKAVGKGYRYSEVMNCPALVPDCRIKMTRQDVPKLDKLCSIVEDDCVGIGVVVYCFNIEAQIAIKNELIKLGRKPVILNGQEDDVTGMKDSDADIVRKVSDFNSGRYDVFITNKQRSLNLQGGDVMIIYSASASVGKTEQICGRIDRHTDDKKKTFILLVYNGEEMNLIADTGRIRGEESRALILNAKTAIDKFMDAIKEAEDAKSV